MDRIVVRVSGQDGAVQAFLELGADRVVSLVDPGTEPPRFPGLVAGRHLVLRLHDLEGPEPGYVEPREPDVAALVALGRALDPGERLVVHCAAGISRSPAAAAVILCAAEGPGSAGRFLAEEGPFLPNALILGIADRLLGTGDALSEAGRMADRHATELIDQADGVW